MSSAPGNLTPPGIPDYELVREIGRGSYGDVWLARGVTGIWRAIKIVWRARFADAEPFEREFRGLKEFAEISLGESSQLALLHVGRNDAAGFFYYVMELADDAAHGRTIDPANYMPLTLAELRARRGRITAEEGVKFGVELARRLADLHRRGLVHRDIKPSNVILVDGVPKLADIGLVAPTANARTFIGTEGFVPPEGPGSPGADVFALGKVLYELATGLDRNDFPQLPPAIARLPDAAALMELNKIILRACDPVPQTRYRDAAAFLADLTTLQAGRTVRHFRAWPILPLAACVAVVAGAVVWRRSQSHETAVAAPISGAAKLADEARQHYAGFLTQAGLALAEDSARRATELDPQLAHAWAVRAGVQAAYLYREWARGEEAAKRATEAQTFANRALALDPNEAEALVALGMVAANQGANEQAEGYYRRAHALDPNNVLGPRYLSLVLRQTGRLPAAIALMKDAAARFPRDAVTHYNLANCYTIGWNYPKAWDEYRAAQADQPFAGAQAAMARLALNWKGDVALMRSLIDQLDLAARSDDDLVAMDIMCSLLERRADRLREALGHSPGDFLAQWQIPKAAFLAQAFRFEGKLALAQQQWEIAAAMLLDKLRSNPNALIWHLRLATMLAQAGRTAEARAEFEIVQPAWRESINAGRANNLATYYAAAGDAAHAVEALRLCLNRGPGVSPTTVHDLQLQPWYDKIRDAPEFQELIANPPPRPTPVDG